MLQGSVLLQVNVGPIAICEVFLGSNSLAFDPLYVAQLRKAMSRLCFEARALLLLNGAIIDATQRDFHSALIEGYNDMRLKLKVTQNNNKTFV
jgi:hypothetical protein